MSIHHHETEFDCFLDRFFATVEIEFEVTPGEKTVLYDRNGDGYPGSDPSLDIISVMVTSLSNEAWDKNLEELVASGFADWLNKEALAAVEEELSDDSWLYDTLFEVASSDLDYND